MGTLIWMTIALFLTLAVFSFLFRDNVLYKFAEHLFVGVSVGYTVYVSYTNLFLPRVWNPLRRAIGDGNILLALWLALGLLVGILFFSRFTQNWSWVSRYPISITVGFVTGYSIIPSLKARILSQFYGTVVDPVGDSLLNAEKIGVFLKEPTLHNFFFEAMAGPLLVFGVFVVIVYFFFSFKNTNPVVRFSRNPALVYLMVAFGASFGYTFMGRISLFIGRMNFIFHEWWPVFRNMISG